MKHYVYLIPIIFRILLEYLPLLLLLLLLLLLFCV